MAINIENVQALGNKTNFDVNMVNESAYAEIQEVMNGMTSLTENVSLTSLAMQL